MARFVEDAMFQLHHLHRSPVAASDLRGQLLAEDRQLFAVRRANMRRKISLAPSSRRSGVNRSRSGSLLADQPREPAAVIDSPECQASIALNAMPAQVGDLKSFAAHGLHGIPEDRLDMSDFYEHARSGSARRQVSCADMRIRAYRVRAWEPR